MDNDNLPMEEPQDTGAVESTQPELAFDQNNLRFVDTADPEYWAKELGQETEQPQAEETPQDTEQPQYEEEYQGSGNAAYDALEEWAKGRGLELNPEYYDLESFDEKQMEEIVGQYYAKQYYNKVDPQIDAIAEQGINLQEYVQQRAQYEQLINTDPMQVAKGHLYNQKIQEMHQYGMLQTDENGNLTPQGQQAIMQQVESLASQMGDERLRHIGFQLHEQYKQQMNSLPQQMQQQRMQQQYEEAVNYNNQINKAVNDFAEYFKENNKFVTEFSGEAEKEDFLNYLQENMAVRQTENGYEVPFYQKLNDSDYLAKLLRLSHLLDRGAITDISNRERNAAYNKLSISPVVGKNTSRKKSSGGLRIMPTWENGYNK